MADREIPKFEYDSKVKNKIRDTATELFATRGYGAVSIKDITDACKIKKSALYNYYQGKEALFNDILQRFEKNYHHLITWLTEENSKAETLDEVLDNMYCNELMTTADIIGRYSIALVMKEQHSNARAKQFFYELLVTYSIERMALMYDNLVEKGQIPPTNTKAVARITLFHFLAMNDFYIHELRGEKLPPDIIQMSIEMKDLIKHSLTAA